MAYLLTIFHIRAPKRLIVAGPWARAFLGQAVEHGVSAALFHDPVIPEPGACFRTFAGKLMLFAPAIG